MQEERRTYCISFKTPMKPRKYATSLRLLRTAQEKEEAEKHQEEHEEQELNTMEAFFQVEEEKKILINENVQ